MDNKLLKLNNEYVKLYITTNKNLPELLKNSGSLIVYHDKTSDIIGTNYLYLGNEVLASGWGFNTKQQKNKIINYLDELPTKITTIQEDLDNIKKGITSNENLYITKNSDLGNYKDLYISKNYFPSNIINGNNNDNNNIKIKDLPQLLNKATYKEEEITSVEYSIENINGTKINFKKDDLNKYFYVPYNSDIKFKITINYKTNDTGGAVKNIKFNDENLISEIPDNTNGDEYTLIITKDLYNINEIIDPDIYITFKETPSEKYKFYNKLNKETESSIDNTLYSIENIIPEHTVRINNLFERYKIIPTYEICYSTTLLENSFVNNIPDYDQQWTYIGNLQNFNMPSLNNFKKVLIINENNITFNLEIKNDRYLLIFMIPTLYNINKIMLCSSDNKIKKNILGEFKILYNYNFSNIIYTILDFDDNNYYLKFELSKNNINNETTIKATNALSGINLLDTNIINNTYYLTNDDFDGSHWYNGPENNYILNEVIPNILLHI